MEMKVGCMVKKRVVSLVVGLTMGTISASYASENTALLDSHASDIHNPRHDDATDTWAISNKLALNLPPGTAASHRAGAANTRVPATSSSNHRYLRMAFNEPQRTPVNVDTHLMALQLNVDDKTELKIKLHAGYYFSVSKRW